MHIDLWQSCHFGISKTGCSSCVNKRTAETGHLSWQLEEMHGHYVVIYIHRYPQTEQIQSEESQIHRVAQCILRGWGRWPLADPCWECPFKEAKMWGPKNRITMRVKKSVNIAVLDQSVSSKFQTFQVIKKRELYFYKEKFYGSSFLHY